MSVGREFGLIAGLLYGKQYDNMHTVHATISERFSAAPVRGG